jgi:hypothetical protein
MDDLLEEQYIVSDEQATLPVTEDGKHAQPLKCLLSHPVDGC